MLYIVYRTAKESHGDSVLYGFISVSIIVISFVVMYALISSDCGWIIAPLILVVTPVYIKISCVSKVNATDDDELKIEDYLHKRIQQSSFSASEKLHYDVMNTTINKIRSNRKTLLENNDFATSMCDTLIPIAWAVAPIFYAYTNVITPFDTCEFVLCYTPFTIVTFYFKILMHK